MYAQTQQVIPQEFAVDLIAEIYDQGVGRELNNLPLFRTRKKAELEFDPDDLDSCLVCGCTHFSEENPIILCERDELC